MRAPRWQALLVLQLLSVLCPVLTTAQTATNFTKCYTCQTTDLEVCTALIGAAIVVPDWRYVRTTISCSRLHDQKVGDVASYFLDELRSLTIVLFRSSAMILRRRTEETRRSVEPLTIESQIWRVRSSQTDQLTSTVNTARLLSTDSIASPSRQRPTLAPELL